MIYCRTTHPCFCPFICLFNHASHPSDNPYIIPSSFFSIYPSIPSISHPSAFHLFLHLSNSHPPVHPSIFSTSILLPIYPSFSLPLQSPSFYSSIHPVLYHSNLHPSIHPFLYHSNFHPSTHLSILFSTFLPSFLYHSNLHLSTYLSILSSIFQLHPSIHPLIHTSLSLLLSIHPDELCEISITQCDFLYN